MQHNLQNTVNLIENNDFVNKLGQTIRRLRLSLGITPHEFAEDIGCDFSFLLKLEEGRIDPDLITIQKCAHALHVKISDLITMIDTPSFSPNGSNEA